jgi:hypothetical protein
MTRLQRVVTDRLYAKYPVERPAVT